MIELCYQSDLEHLPTSKVLEFLSSTDHGVITRPPTNPKGGDVYLYSYGEDVSKKGQFATLFYDCN